MNPKICPTCQAPVPPHAPGGFCPACLLRDADEPPANGHAAPSLDEIAAAFPQLEVIGLIGQGGMGFVYQVRQPGLDRTVALKILSPELGRDPAFAERFARESRALGKLNHPNIVTVFEHGVSQPSTLNFQPFFYLLMEYVDGVNLRQAMRAGRFTPEQALAIVPGICDALQAAHAQGIWHRDIKPENILLDARGEVKIADFGIARMVGDPQRNFTLTMTGGALGSAAYMAPEQHETPRDVDHRADIYSLGVVIYEMLTGELPLGRFPAPSQRAAVDARIDEIVFKTLEKERELRQQSATEVKTDVQGVGKVPLAATRTPVLKRGFGKVVAGIAGLILLSALGVFIHYSWFVKPGTSQGNYDYQWSEATSSDAEKLILVWKLALSEMDKPDRNYSLGPVVEVLLPEPAADGSFMLNFENGNLFAPNPELGQQLRSGGSSYVAPRTMEDWSHITEGRYRWLQIQGVNAFVTMPDCNSIQFFATLPFPLDFKFEDSDSDKILHVIRERMDTHQPMETLVKHFNERSFIQLHSQPGQAFAFIAPQTFGATMGLVEVIGKSASPQRGLKIRYRLVKRLPDTWQADAAGEAGAANPAQTGEAGIVDSFDHQKIADETKEQGAKSMLEESMNSKFPKARKVDEDNDWSPWAEYLKDGDRRVAIDDRTGALKSYRDALAYVEKLQINNPEALLDVQPMCLARIGDVLKAQGDFAQASENYQSSQAIVKKLLMRTPEDAEVRDELTGIHVKMGDTQIATGDQPGAAKSYRDAVAISEKLERNWETEYPNGSHGDDLARDYQAEETLRLIDKPDRDSWDLMWMIGQAGAIKDGRLRPLLERKDLLKDENLALALAGYDFSLNGNQKGLDFILAKLAERPIGADVNEVIVLSFLDEWDRSIKAVNSHFLATDGAGGDCMNSFWGRRMLLFPRRYLEFKGKVTALTPEK